MIKNLSNFKKIIKLYENNVLGLSEELDEGQGSQEHSAAPDTR